MLEDKIRHVLEDLLILPQEAKLVMFRRRASVYRFHVFSREIVQVK